MRWHYVWVGLYSRQRQRSSEVSVCCGEPSLPVFVAAGAILSFYFVVCSCFYTQISLSWWPNHKCVVSLWFAVTPRSYCDWFRFHVNAQIWSDLSELFDPTPELKVSVHVFQRSDGFPGHSGVLFPILSVTVSALDPLWHTHALTHLTYIQ